MEDAAHQQSILPVHSQLAESSIGVEPPEGVVIWTPLFMLVFAVTLAVGLSLISVVTQGWLNKSYLAESALLCYLGGVFAVWLIAVIYTRTTWVRVGCSAVCIWCLFMGANYILRILAIDPNSLAAIYVNDGASCSLLVASLGLAATTPRTVGWWERWLFRLLPLAALAGAEATALTTLSWPSTANTIAALSLMCSLIIWWVRSEGWRVQPGLTWWLGLVPALYLLLALPIDIDGQTNFMVLQLVLLCQILGGLRLLQGERLKSLSSVKSASTDSSR